MRDCSNVEAGVNIIKGAVGLGLLNLPYATAQLGLLPSLLGMVLVGFMSVLAIFYAVMAKQKWIRTENDELTPLQSEACGSGAGGKAAAGGASPGGVPSELGLGFFDHLVRETFGRPGQVVYAVSILLCQIGTCIAYITVIAESVQLAFGLQQQRHRLMILLFFSVVLAALSLVKTLHGVAYLSTLGLLSYLFIFAAVLIESGDRIAEGTWGQDIVLGFPPHAEVELWFGIVCFAFGAFPIVIAVHDEMREPRHFFAVAGWSYAIICAVYMVFAFAGYCCYGQGTNEIIFYNFQRAWLRFGSFLCITVVLTFTYVLQMVPVYLCAQTLVGDRVNHSLLRTMLVASTTLVAYLVPSTAVLVEVTGAFAAAIASLSLPALVYLRLNPRPTWSEYPLALALVVFGGLGAVRALV